MRFTTGLCRVSYSSKHETDPKRRHTSDYMADGTFGETPVVEVGESATVICLKKFKGGGTATCNADGWAKPAGCSGALQRRAYASAVRIVS